MKNKTLINVIGPTAIGKTRLGIALALHFNTEVISADSRQFYNEMQIGTAVPEPEELAAAKHHFIQHISIDTPYSVGTYEKEAILLLGKLYQNYREVILVGGSGLYVDAVNQGLDEFPEITPGIREELQGQLEDKGIQSLQEALREHDPEYYSTVDQENPHRLIRALEVCISSGLPYSSFRNARPKEREFNSLFIGLDAPREVIYDRINRRVDLMIAKGLEEEAQSLHEKKHLPALQTVGYRELFHYFEGNCSREEAIEEIKKNTRRFAKRQLTWYRKRNDVHWFPYDREPGEIASEVEHMISNE